MTVEDSPVIGPAAVLGGSDQDLSEQHELARQLAESEARYRLLAEHASDIVTLINTDGTLEWASPSLARTLGWDPARVTGAPVWHLIHPDDQEAVAVVLASDDEEIHSMSDVELRLKRDDGSFAWMLAAGRHATETKLVVSLRPIEDQVQARKELVASEQHYRLLADNATDVVYLVGPDRLVTWISPTVSQTLGWSPEELLGTSMYELIHADDRAAIDALREAVFEGRDIPNPAGGWPSRFRRKDGSFVWMSLKTTTIRGEDGQMVSAVTGMKDVDAFVTARDRAEAEQARLAATLGSLLDPHVLLQAVRDPDGRIVDFIYADVNDAACDYMQLGRHQLEGALLLDLLPGQAGSGMLAMYAGAIESGRPLALDDYAYPHEILEDERRYDIRAVRVGDALSFTWRDVTDRHRTAERIADSERHYRLLADNSSDVVLHSRDGIVLWVSPSLTRTLGWAPSEVIGMDSRLLVHPDDLRHLAGGEVPEEGTRVQRYRLHAKNGAYHWCDVHSAAFIDEAGNRNGIVASFRTIDDEVAAERELERRALFDELTGAYKRDEAVHRLLHINQNVRRSGSDAAVLFCDVDNLKQVNDEHGHAAGDELLRSLADRLHRAVRSSDTVARVGGDEFLIILDGVHGLEEAKALAQKIRVVALELTGGGQATGTSLSIGLTMARPGEDAEQTIDRADRAMYDAKRAGRNTVRTLNPA